MLICDLLDAENARGYAQTIGQRLADELDIKSNGVIFEAAEDLKTAVGQSDVIFTITRSTEPLIMKEWLRPGTHISCIGADMVGKEEIDPEIFRDARSFADDALQCCTVGEMEIPAKMGIISPDTVTGEMTGDLSLDVVYTVKTYPITVHYQNLDALDLVTAKIAVATAEAEGKGQTAEI